MAAWSQPGSRLCTAGVRAGSKLDSTGKIVGGVEGFVACEFVGPVLSGDFRSATSWTSTSDNVDGVLDFTRDFFVQVAFSCYWPTVFSVDRPPTDAECRGAKKNGERVFSRAVMVKVAAKPTPVLFNVPPQLPAARVGRPFRFSFCAPAVPSGKLCGPPFHQTTSPRGGSPPYTFRLKVGGGLLPPGLVLSTRTGQLSGTPRRAGPWPFTVCVYDSRDTHTGVCHKTTLVVRP